MRYNLTIATILSIFLFSCKDKQPTKKETPTVIKNKGLEIVSNMVQKVGNYNITIQKLDVPTLSSIEKEPLANLDKVNVEVAMNVLARIQQQLAINENTFITNTLVRK